jgi:tRNA (guanine-N1)-methyltransferase
MFPEAFPGNLGVSLIGKSLLENKWDLNIIDLKRFPAKSDRIDSVPYGGGSGMVLLLLLSRKLLIHCRMMQIKSVEYIFLHVVGR